MSDKKKIIRLLILITGICVIILFNNFSKRFDNSYEKTIQSLAFDNSADTNIILIKITPEDLAQLGNWPLTRDYYIMLFKALTEYNPKVIGLEVFLSGNKPEQIKYDEMLHNTITNAGNVVLSSIVARLNANEQNFIADSIMYPPIKRKYNDIKTGHLNYIEKNMIHIPPYVVVDKKSEPCFALALLNEEKDNYDELINLNLQHSWKNYRSYSLVDFFQLNKANNTELNSLRDKYILIGVTDPKLAKSVLTTFDEYLPGVGFHALVLDNLINKTNWIDKYYSASIIIFILLLLTIISFSNNKNIGKVYLLFIVFFFLTSLISTNILNLHLAFSAFLIPILLLLIFELYLFFNTSNK